MLQRKIEYNDGDILLEGYYAVDESKPGKKPAILVAHDWGGRNDFACKKAEKLAELGYVGFALDMFGKNILGNTKEEKMALIKPLMEDREALAKRIISAFDTVKKLDFVDNKQIGAIGFCFGGLCVLDLARQDVEGLCAVVSFHGLLMAPEDRPHKPISAKILALHGFDDPMVPVEQVIAFQNEMTAARADWQFHVYGGTMHAFTNPLAHDPGFGTVYNSLADSRSWIEMKDFFAETFA